MSPYLTRPLRTYAEAAYDVALASMRPGVRLTDERMRLLEIIERELKHRERSIITATRISR